MMRSMLAYSGALIIFLRPGILKDPAQYIVSKAAKDLGLYAADHEDEGVSLDDLKTFLREVKRLTAKAQSSIPATC